MKNNIDKKLSIVFVSNYMNIHQLPFSLAINNIPSVEYTFIATTSVPEFRLKNGFIDMNHSYDFILCAYESKMNQEKAIELCTNCDVLLFENAAEFYVKKRMKLKKLTFRCSERIYKRKTQLLQLPLRAMKYHLRDRLNTNVYMLCRSAYATSDYNKSLNYIGKTYKFGYFTEVKTYDDINLLIQNKKRNSILWVARLIKLKHPEMVIEIAKRLKQDNYEFSIHLIGSGELESNLKESIRHNHLDNNVHLIGAISPENVRRYMEESEIFLFTSDRGEGWGAVLNESMNSGCAVVASHEIGSVPWLIKDKENGLIFKDQNIEDLYIKVKFLLDNPERRKNIGLKAYQTMIKDWTPKVAAQRLITLSQYLLDKKENEKNEPFIEGVCSKANKLKDNWYLKKELYGKY